MSGIVRIEQVPGKRKELATVFCNPTFVDRIVFLEPWTRFNMLETCLVGRYADLTATELARDVDHFVVL